MGKVWAMGEVWGYWGVWGKFKLTVKRGHALKK